MTQSGDQAFRKSDNMGRWPEMTYGGALSFLRRRYSRDLDGVDLAVMGVPYDSAVTFRSGCRLGPQAVRAASVQLAELLAFPWGFDPFETLGVVDYGDVFLDPHHPDTIAPAIYTAARDIIAGGTKLLSIGGDHSIAYPLIKAHAEKYGSVALVQFDAHCDTWPDDGTRMDHGTMFARAARDGIIDVSRSTQVGLRTYNDSDHGFEILTSPWIHRNGIDAVLDVVRTRAGDAPVYISFDIDGLDPAYAPGTGTPVPGGLASWQALEFIRGLAGLNLIGMDLVEVSPPFDTSEITALAAAHVAHDWICVLAQAAVAVMSPVGRV
jgi:agmatinase